MKIHNFESATLRTVTYENKNNITTRQFDCFDEALEHLTVGDSVLAFVNGGRYIMKIFALDDNYIMCADDVGNAQFRRNSKWTINGLERVQYD